MRIGCIGCGNMARALLAGIAKEQKEVELVAADPSADARRAIKEVCRVRTMEENHGAISGADLLLLAVKPQILPAVLEEIRTAVEEQTVVVSLAPGKTLDWLEEQFGRPMKIIRTMPNTPALVGEGMTALCANARVSEEEKERAQQIFDCVGETAWLPESLLDTVTGVSGSSPGYVFLFLEALADAAVEGGMPREEAYRFAAQSVLGSAKMVLETGKHPAELKDMVCSPGGTTIEALRVLEKRGFRSAVIEATRACIQKSKGM